MAKRAKERKNEKVEHVHVPKLCQQSRSRTPKPRTDFSPFACSPSTSSSSAPPSLSPPLLDAAATTAAGSMLDHSRFKDGCSSITTARMEQRCKDPISSHQNEILKFPLVQGGMSKNKGLEHLFSNSIGVQFTEVESGSHNALLSFSDNRKVRKQGSATTGTLSFTPDKFTSTVTESNDVWTPGSVVWAKRACQMWRPLECFGVKSYNPIISFQDALKQNLHRKKHTSPFRVSGENPEIQHSQTPDKWNASNSSRTEDDHVERGREKRKRKPKVHFDEGTFPTRSVKKLRRLRIMRHLGLIAPIGSPFSLHT
ncbi:PREDICTED: uncharacterized protein LOC104587329 isoform X2 [Nelumbo nucifera]|uniref:Uncharacterized protein n=2 Tax=Nelumbo nucifera TaxID=4432 RepID=A0A822YUZ2_NELNU|nr:PREDICTED: uncharacterized protein LOC104587329 isoform X2 [Nelumbo nucifera]DAD36340.1 TPA_asm: hypothetical protein HUJ06_006981 [Nelumbo nucifera]